MFILIFRIFLAYIIWNILGTCLLNNIKKHFRYIKNSPTKSILRRLNKKTRKNAIVEYLDYQIPVTQREIGDMEQQSQI